MRQPVFLSGYRHQIVVMPPCLTDLIGISTENEDKTMNDKTTELLKQIEDSAESSRGVFYHAIKHQLALQIPDEDRDALTAALEKINPPSIGLTAIRDC